jgi:transposase InsO family protein
MSKAQLVITAVVLEGRSKSEVACDYDVSRTWVQQLVRRYQAEGNAAFAPRSRWPHHNPRAVPIEVEDKIVRLRKTLAKHGFDAGAATIAEHLARDPAVTKVPATSTIWRILKRRGFVVPQPQKRPRSSWKRFCADLPNECWQADVTHWRLADQTEVEILDLLDDHSRAALASQARSVSTGPDVVDTFTMAFARWGTPAGVLTDNGAIFTAQQRGHGRTAREITLGELGIKYRRARPYHPQTCGKVERFHQTLKNIYGRYPQPPPSPSCNTSSTHSWPTTTGSDPTAPSADTPSSRSSTTGPRPSRPATGSPRTTACATTPSTPPASSPSATTATCTTSACPNTYATPTSSSWPTTSTSACWTATPEHSSANWSSTPPATTNPAASNAETHPKTGSRCQQCLGTSANDVPRTSHRRADSVWLTGFEPATT